MVQVTFDTTTDTLPELEEALALLRGAIARRKGTVSSKGVDSSGADLIAGSPFGEPSAEHASRGTALDMPASGFSSVASDAAQKSMVQESDEETALDTPFIKITVKDASHVADAGHASSNGGMGGSHDSAVPTLNQLLTDASLTEDELTKMFKEQTDAERAAGKTAGASSPGSLKKQASQDADGYIEIVEYSEEK